MTLRTVAVSTNPRSSFPDPLPGCVRAEPGTRNENYEKENRYEADYWCFVGTGSFCGVACAVPDLEAWRAGRPRSGRMQRCHNCGQLWGLSTQGLAPSGTREKGRLPFLQALLACSQTTEPGTSRQATLSFLTGLRTPPA